MLYSGDMKIVTNNRERLDIIFPNSAFRIICWILIGLGAIVSILVLGSGEGWYNGIIGYLFLIAGVLGRVLGGKPSQVEFDRRANAIRFSTYQGSFGSPELSEIRLSDVSDTDVKSRLPSISSSVKNTTYNVLLLLREGDPVDLSPYYTSRRPIKRLNEDVRQWLGFGPPTGKM